MSFEDLTAVWQIESMKEIIGKTRYGKRVWIEILRNDSGFLQVHVVQFASAAENYDTFCIVEAYRHRLTRSLASRELSTVNLTAIALVEYLEGPKPKGFLLEAAALRHTNSPQRLRYGMKLLHPAYRSN